MTSIGVINNYAFEIRKTSLDVIAMASNISANLQPWLQLSEVLVVAAAAYVGVLYLWLLTGVLGVDSTTNRNEVLLSSYAHPFT